MGARAVVGERLEGRVVRGVVIAMAAATAGVGATAPARAGEADIWLMPEVRFQKFYGFGQGSMHQANPRFFKRYPKAVLERHLDRLYTMKPGCLGMRVCRFNITVGDDPAHNHMGRRPGGSKNPLGYEPKDGQFRWDGHEDVLWHARGAAERGATMLAFWNSPPHWLTISGCSAGGPDPMKNNTRPGQEGRFAKHIADVLEHFAKEWRIRFEYVCPVNEPELHYWKQGGGQEGCHTDAPQASRICVALAKELSRRWLRTPIQAPEMAASKSLDYIDKLMGDSAAAPTIETITLHQYAVNDAELRKWALRARRYERPLWMSEWGKWTNLSTKPADQLAHMKAYAAKIHQAFHVMHAESWSMWEPSFIFSEEAEDIAPKKSYWTVAQWSRYVRPGMQRIEAVDTRCRTTAWVDALKRRLVIVSYNPHGQAVRARFDLARFAGARVEEVRRTSPDEDFAEVKGGFARRIPTGGSLKRGFPANSVTTIVIRYDRTRSGPVRNPSFESGDLSGWKRDAGPSERVGVEESYPASGLYDGFLHPTPDRGRRMETRVTGLRGGKTYVASAACAASNTVARFGVTSGGKTVSAEARGGGYVQLSVRFTPRADGGATIFYECDPGRAPAGKWPWATIDSVFVREAE
jgi:O-glycosyl hydrolase